MQKTSSEGAPTRLHLHGSTMGTRWSVKVDGALNLDREGLHPALQACVDEVDAQMSPWKPESDLVRLNRAQIGSWVTLPPEMMEVLARALEINRLSNGAFDPGVGDLVDAWGFGPLRDTPDAAAIRFTRSLDRKPCYQRLELDVKACRARKFTPLQLDLCGIAKGYAVDGMVAVLAQQGVQHGLAAIDGELRALGRQANGEAWPIALESPQVGVRALHGVIEMEDLAVATSGDYRHFVQIGESRLAHTMDSRRVGPVQNGVTSVTVLAPTCMDADAWATALLVIGPDQGLPLAQRLGLDVLLMQQRVNGLVEIGTGRFGHSGLS